jgi:synaptic vesicle membrane protein VAT-1
MKKILIEKPGSYDQLKIVEAASLTPKENEVVVETIGIGVNYADCLVRFGIYESAKKYVGWPITPGFEFSGKIKACGRNAKRFKVGDVVFGFTRFNAYASEVCLPENQVFPVPQNLNVLDMAGFPAVFFTAYHALCQLVKIYPGSKVLIHSAAGGVGSALVSLCKVLGHKSVGVIGSSKKRDYLRGLGCEVIIDKSKEDLWQRAKAISPEGYDAVFDANGYTTYRDSYEHLRPSGKLVCYGSHSLLPKAGGRMNYLKAAVGFIKTPRFNPLEMITQNKTVSAFNISFLFDRGDMIEEINSDLQKWLTDGLIKPVPTTVLAFADVKKAHQLIESGQSTGKIILQL